MGSSYGSPSSILRESTYSEARLSPLSTAHEAPEAPSTGSEGLEEFGTPYAKPGGFLSKDIGMLWPVVANESRAPQYIQNPPTPVAPVSEVDAIYAAEAPLRQLLALASVVGLPRQIEREEAKVVSSPQLLDPLITEGHVSSLGLLGKQGS